MNSMEEILNKKITIVKNDKFPVRKQKKERELLCSLTVNFIDPANFSPPNNFLENLRRRMDIYEDMSGNLMKNDNRERE